MIHGIEVRENKCRRQIVKAKGRVREDGGGREEKSGIVEAGKSSWAPILQISIILFTLLCYASNSIVVG